MAYACCLLDFRTIPTFGSKLNETIGDCALKIELTEDVSSKIKKRDLPRFARTESEFSG